MVVMTVKRNISAQAYSCASLADLPRPTAIHHCRRRYFFSFGGGSARFPAYRYLYYGTGRLQTSH